TKYTITCDDGATDDPDEASASATVTVNGGEPSDLIASAVTADPNPVQVGAAATLSATITNQGKGSTGAGFTDLYEIDNDADHNTLYDTATDHSPKLDAGATDPSQVAYTFPNEGTWYVRACADKRNQGDADGVIAESNEDNNCSDGTENVWTQVVVTEKTKPNLTGIYRGPTIATDGEPTTLDGTIYNKGGAGTRTGFTNAFEINPDSIPGDFADIQSIRTKNTGALGAGASQDITATYTFDNGGIQTRTWYVRVCADTDAHNDGTIDESNEGDNCGDWTPVTITTNPDSCGSGSSGLLTADPDRVATGTPTTLVWRNVRGVPAQSACKIVTSPDIGTMNAGTSDANCKLSDGGPKKSPNVPTQTLFQLVCGGVDVHGASAVVDVAPIIQEF
ncbi:MAG TPA: CARDB domain-containing protein, partial [Candidatus Paceibacterota bacterium]|nr:CARDB domain-containing protein [Candidatus Paceibacterota bacterium]